MPDEPPDLSPDPVEMLAGLSADALFSLLLLVSAVSVDATSDLPPKSAGFGLVELYRSLYQPPPLNAKEVREIRRSSAPPQASHSVRFSLIRCSYSNCLLHDWQRYS